MRWHSWVSKDEQNIPVGVPFGRKTYQVQAPEMAHLPCGCTYNRYYCSVEAQSGCPSDTIEKSEPMTLSLKEAITTILQQSADSMNHN